MLFTTLALAALAAAHPVEKRQEPLPPTAPYEPLSTSDAAVVQLAHFLENLEFSLYSGGYDNFTDAQYTAQGFPANFRENVGLIAQQEALHRDTLAGLLTASGMTPLPACTYSFPYTDPASFVALANMITTVGIGAYLGGEMMLTDNANLAVSAGTILTNEVRHDTFLRLGAGGAPFPNTFDTPVTALWAYNLASAFIVSCPTDLSAVEPVVKLPVLNVTSPAPSPNLTPLPNGTVISYSWDPSKFFVPVSDDECLYIAYINQIYPPVFELVTKTGEGTGTAPLPDGLQNSAFAVLTTFSGGLNETQLSQFGTLAGPQEIVVS